MQFRDLAAQYARHRTEIDDAIQRVLDRAEFIGGPEVEAFERRLAAFAGARHCVSCANGTDAMTLVLMAWGIGPGDAVFVPDFTFFSTAEVVSLAGATPVFVDVDPETFNLDPVRLEAHVTRVAAEGRLVPKAAIPVDLYGLPADHDAIGRVAERHGLLVLEDGAQGFGGAIRGRRVGAFGDAATTSFFPAKPLGCYGDGGAVFTADDATADRLRSLKVHGKGRDKYDNLRIGLNSRLDTLQAAILQVKLSAFEEHELEDVNRVAQRYTERLQGLVETPVVPEGYFSSWAQYTLRLPDRATRDGLQAFLKAKGIPSLVYYVKPLHRQTAYADLGCDDRDFPVSDRLCDTVLSLPMHPYLADSEIDAVCDAIEEFLR